jgi:hypothetical protein
MKKKRLYIHEVDAGHKGGGVIGWLEVSIIDIIIIDT